MDIIKNPNGTFAAYRIGAGPWVYRPDVNYCGVYALHEFNEAIRQHANGAFDAAFRKATSR